MQTLSTHIAPENLGGLVGTACQHKRTGPIPWSAGAILAGIGQNYVKSCANNYTVVACLSLSLKTWPGLVY